MIRMENGIEASSKLKRMMLVSTRCYLSFPPLHTQHDSPHFSVLGRQALLASVCRVQRITRRGEGRCVSQSVSALLTGLHGRLLTLLCKVSAHTTVVT